LKYYSIFHYCFLVWSK